MKRSFIFFTLFGVITVSTAFAETVLFDIPYSRQRKAYSCGQNNFRMIMGYWNERLSKTRIFLWTGWNPTTHRTFEKIIKEKYPNFTFQYIDKNPQALRATLRAGRPVMIPADARHLDYLDYGTASGHYITLIGYDDSRNIYFLRDPNTKYVEAISGHNLQKAWAGSLRKPFTIFRNDNKHVEAGRVEHFNDARGYGAKKEVNMSALLGLLVPSAYVGYGSQTDHEIKRGFERTTLKDDVLYNLKWFGLQYGRITLEKQPWVGNDKSFRGFGANFGVALPSFSLLFNNSEALSPGSYHFARARTLDTHSFNTIKRIRYLNMSALVLEGSYYTGDEFRDEYNSSTGLVAITKVKGGRGGLRYGLGPLLGNASAGVSYQDVDVTVAEEAGQVTPLAYDLAIGPIFASYQEWEHSFSNDVSLKNKAYSYGVNLNLPLQFPLLNLLGLPRLFFQVSVEEDALTQGSKVSSAKTEKKKFEAPVPLKYVDLVYGFVYQEKTTDAGLQIDREAGLKFLFNHFLPHAQLQIGYQYAWSNLPDGGTIEGHRIDLGFFAGWY